MMRGAGCVVRGAWCGRGRATQEHVRERGNVWGPGPVRGSGSGPGSYESMHAAMCGHDAAVGLRTTGISMGLELGWDEENWGAGWNEMGRARGRQRHFSRKVRPWCHTIEVKRFNQQTDATSVRVRVWV